MNTNKLFARLAYWPWDVMPLSWACSRAGMWLLSHTQSYVARQDDGENQ
jgi:hypothetical protein